MTDEQPYTPTAEEVLMVIQQMNPAAVQMAVQDCIIRHQAEEIEQLRATARCVRAAGSERCRRFRRDPSAAGARGRAGARTTLARVSNTPFGSPLLPGQAYWPMGDIYPLTDVWSDFHTSQSIIVGPESAITYNMLVPYGYDWSMSVTLTDLGDVLDYTWWYPGDDAAAAADDTVPSGYIKVESSITKPWGWSGPLRFTITQVLDASLLWTGELKISVPVALQQQLGIYEPWQYLIRTILNSGDGPYPVYTLLGSIAVRQ